MSQQPLRDVLAPAFIAVALVAMSTPVCAAMPASEQNALVKKYCAICHTDAARNGGLSLQHYDAAKRDPTLAAMMLSKLNIGAMGAAGIGVPDKAAQLAWLASTQEQATGSDKWFVSNEDGVISASIVRGVPPRSGSTDVPVYRLRISCAPSTGTGEMQLTWAPLAQIGRTMTVSVDGAVPLEYKIEGKESMGNGGTAQTGHSSVLLSGGGRVVAANRSLTIQGLFPNETANFPISDLDQNTSASLRKCF